MACSNQLSLPRDNQNVHKRESHFSNIRVVGKQAFFSTNTRWRVSDLKRPILVIGEYPVAKSDGSGIHVWDHIMYMCGRYTRTLTLSDIHNVNSSFIRGLKENKCK